MIVKVAAFHVDGIVGGCLPSASSEGSEGEAVEVGFVCHAVILQGQGRTMVATVDSASAVTFLAGSLV